MRAIRLYERIGFEKEGVLKDAVRLDGLYKDMFLMAIVNHSDRQTRASAP